MSKTRAQVHRPPTPEADDQEPRELTLEETVQLRLQQSGEQARLKELLEERLTECGWRDEVKQRCRSVMQAKGLEHVTVDDLVRAVRPAGRAAVPDSVKAELLQQLRDFVASTFT